MFLTRSTKHISIHAPREGSDKHTGAFDGGAKISIHAPREGSDQSSTRQSLARWSFLSTLPARGATRESPGFKRGECHFYPRSPRGERPGQVIVCMPMPEFLSTLPARGATADNSNRMGVSLISIHAPRDGSDVHSVGMRERNQGFLSTLPARGATRRGHRQLPRQHISIHAPREGSDPVFWR